jgi:hypothetical protein
MPPTFAPEQKLVTSDSIDILASKAPKSHEELVTDHGFDPQTAASEEFVEIWERAETKEALSSGKSNRDESDDDSSEEEHPKKKNKKSNASFKGKPKSDHCCIEHGPNTSHDTKSCKVLIGRKEKKHSWKNKDKSEGKHTDYKSKHKKKQNEVNLLQQSVKKEKAKWTKAHKRLKQNEVNNVAADDSSSSDEQEVTEKTVRAFTPREHQNQDSSSSNDSSSSSSDDDSNPEQENGRRENLHGRKEN